MARVDAFGRMWNDNNRDVSVGGRGQSRKIMANLNTDNAGGSDCSIFVKAEVRGERRYNDLNMRKTCRSCGFLWTNNSERECPVCGITRQGIDTRTTTFTIELPELNDHCQVKIREHNAGLGDLAMFGAMLATMKGVSMTTSPDPREAKSGEEMLENIGNMLEEWRKETKKYPKVTLPGNVDLAHALACVDIVERLMRSQDDNTFNGSNN
jgi:rubredoxin